MPNCTHKSGATRGSDNVSCHAVTLLYLVASRYFVGTGWLFGMGWHCGQKW